MKLNHQAPHFLEVASQTLYIFKICIFVKAHQVEDKYVPQNLDQSLNMASFSRLLSIALRGEHRSLFLLDLCHVRLDSSNEREENTGEEQKTNGGERDVRQKRIKYDKTFFADP